MGMFRLRRVAIQAGGHWFEPGTAHWKDSLRRATGHDLDGACAVSGSCPGTTH